MRTTLLPLCLAMYAALMLASCVTSPRGGNEPRAEKNRWEWLIGVIRFRTAITVKPSSFHSKVGKYRAMRGAIGTLPESLSAPTGSPEGVSGNHYAHGLRASRMEFETAFIKAFEASTRYRLEGESLFFQSDIAPPLEFYRRPLER